MQMEVKQEAAADVIKSYETIFSVNSLVECDNEWL